jgi:hypothetical protein
VDAVDFEIQRGQGCKRGRDSCIVIQCAANLALFTGERISAMDISEQTTKALKE